jgi:hypothetical protein
MPVGPSKPCNLDWVNEIRWSINSRKDPSAAYPRCAKKAFDGAYAHQVVIEKLSGVSRREFPKGWTIHHQNFDKEDFRPCNLIFCGPGLNPSGVLGMMRRGGKFVPLSAMRDSFSRASSCDAEPNWVTAES